MPKDTSALHSVESLRHNAREIERLLNQLKTSIDLMQLEPGIIDDVNVFKERSRIDGIGFLRTWTDAVRDAVSDKKESRLRNPDDNGDGVSDSPDTVPLRKRGGKKAGSKRRSSSANPKVSDTLPQTGTG